MKSIFARSLFKSYDGINAVDGIDLDVDEGQIFGFLGPNGAGKSTVIKLLTTLIQPTSGKISVLEIDTTKEPLSIRKKIGVVLQQPSYEPTLSVEKSLEKYGMMWNLDKKTRIDRTEELLISFNLVEIRKKKNEDLSIGQRRRVQVAREFMHDMDLLFLDEPTVGLDPTARRQLLDFLKNKDYIFAHAAKYHLPDKKILIGCYHPSPRNVNTKRINLSKMVKLFKNAKKIII